MKPILLIITLFLGFSTWAGTDKEPIKPISLTNSYQVKQYKDIFFGGQPNQKQLSEMRKQGFATIISLRDASESEGFDEAKEAKIHGLNFVRIPVKDPKAMTPEKIDEITKSIVKNRSKGRVLVHCSSGGRVGLWAGAHFYKDHKYTPEQSQRAAKEVGMPEKFVTYLNGYIKKQKATQAK